MKFECSRQIFVKSLKYQLSSKSVHWEPSCDTDRQTDESNNAIRNFANAPKNQCVLRYGDFPVIRVASVRVDTVSSCSPKKCALFLKLPVLLESPKIHALLAATPYVIGRLWLHQSLSVSPQP
jgi:hypothetical protein